MHKRIGERAHLDLFLDTGAEELTHYYLSLSQRKRNSLAQQFHKGSPHRKIYLTFSGQLSHNRGKVRILSQGHWYSHHQLILKKELVKVRLPAKFARHGSRSSLSSKYTP